jgi:hypothetical protein
MDKKTYTLTLTDRKGKVVEVMILFVENGNILEGIAYKGQSGLHPEIKLDK